MTPPPADIAGPASIPAGAVGIAYGGATFAASGGTSIYGWSATGLPNGLNLSATGLLSGTPALAGTYNPQFAVTDSSGKSVSASLSLTIFPVSAPVISSLSPASANAGGPAFTLTVNGTGFLSGATVQWNGSAIPTMFASATQLTATVAAGLIASAGSAGIVVVNPGGASSGTTALLITPARYSARNRFGRNRSRIQLGTRYPARLLGFHLRKQPRERNLPLERRLPNVFGRRDCDHRQ